MIIWYSFCGPRCQAHTLAHTVSHFHPFSRHHSSLQGSHCQFLSGLIIASLASPCNGPIPGNPEQRARAPTTTKDYCIDSSPTPAPPLCLRLSFLHFFMSRSNFLTVIVRCFLPLDSHDLMQGDAGRSRPAVDNLAFFFSLPLPPSRRCWLHLLRIRGFGEVGALQHRSRIPAPPQIACFKVGGEACSQEGWDNELKHFYIFKQQHLREEERGRTRVRCFWGSCIQRLDCGRAGGPLTSGRVLRLLVVFSCTAVTAFSHCCCWTLAHSETHFTVSLTAYSCRKYSYTCSFTPQSLWREIEAQIPWEWSSYFFCLLWRDRERSHKDDNFMFSQWAQEKEYLFSVLGQQ